MTRQEKFEKKLENTEKALFAVVSALTPLQPSATQEELDKILCEYFDANNELSLNYVNEFTLTTST